MIWLALTYLGDITPNLLPGYQQGADNSSTDITAGKLEPALHFIFATFGVIALLVITVAGIQYMLSQGEPQKVSKAKDSIMYAVIGLVVSMSAYALVSFVGNWVG